MVSKSQTSTKKPKKQAIKRQNSTGSAVGVSTPQKATLIASAILMGLAITLESWFFYLTLPMLIVIILDVLVLAGSIKDETGKRLIILFSILGAVSALYMLWLYYSVATGGLSF